MLLANAVAVWFILGLYLVLGGLAIFVGKQKLHELSAQFWVFYCTVILANAYIAGRILGG